MKENVNEIITSSEYRKGTWPKEYNTIDEPG
jgi:hypothetical protein